MSIAANAPTSSSSSFAGTIQFIFGSTRALACSTGRPRPLVLAWPLTKQFGRNNIRCVPRGRVCSLFLLHRSSLGAACHSTVHGKLPVVSRGGFNRQRAVNGWLRI